jgi:hypothetical protein
LSPGETIGLLAGGDLTAHFQIPQIYNRNFAFGADGNERARTIGRN